MLKIAIARSAAHAMLLAIEAGLGHSDDLLRDDPLMETMSNADRRLTTALVLGVLRWQIQLDALIRAHLTKSTVKLDPAVLIALRLGAFQLLHLDRIPAHAAINESVEIAKRSGYRSAAGLVNAVLRKMATQTGEKADPEVRNRQPQILRLGPAARGFAQNDKTGILLRPSVIAPDPVGSVAAHPEWIVERWTKFFGPETARAICVHDQGAPSSAIRLSAPDVEREVIESGISLSAGHLLTAARVVESGDVTSTAAFREGRVRIQDEGSQLIAEVAASISEKSKKILDCCAAPGGKTLILAERNPAAQIVACEASPRRLKPMRDRLAGVATRMEFRLADAAALTFDSEFDVALADVPCSGTGTLGRNPEIRHRLRPGDLPRQAERQRDLLRSALRAVRPGGRVVYATCSLEPEENEEVIAAVVGSGGSARVVPLGPVLEGLRERGVLTREGAEGLQRCLTPEGWLRLIPGRFGTDGFFVAIMERLPVPMDETPP